MMSGVIMSWFHIDLVRGATTASAPPPPAYGLERPYYPIDQLPVPGGSVIRSLSLESADETPVYDITFTNGDRVLFNAYTGIARIPPAEDQVREIARKDFTGDYSSLSVQLMEAPPQEYRGTTPVWQVQFDDRDRTRLYISAVSGEVVSRRNRIWRLYDFFWMLHIMDYGEREDFNNPLIRAASATGFVFALSGLILVILRLRAGRYRQDLSLLGRITKK